MPFWRRDKQTIEDGDLHLVVGLGNPGGQYENTRHNVGYMVVNLLAQRHRVSFKSAKQRADVARVTVEGVPLLLALPLTFMNDSGDAVVRLVQYYRIALDRVLVVCDDIDLPFGTLRLRPSGSSGGNRGLESIIQALGTEEFGRLRLGVGRPRGAAVSHVLTPFSREEGDVLPRFIGIGADAVQATLRQGLRQAMNDFNRDWMPELVL